MTESVDSKSKDSPEPPQPKEIERRVSFYSLQAVGIPILALIPIAALFGLFDSSNGSLEATGQGIRLQVAYPKRLRFETNKPVVIMVWNDTGQAIPKATLKISRQYIDEFERAEFTPDADSATDEAYLFELRDLKPGEPQKVGGRLEFDHLKTGMHAGEISVSINDRNVVSADFKTFLFP
jgi:hypothetical protein